jgi:hypothetical protein
MLEVDDVWMMVHDFVMGRLPHQRPPPLGTLQHRGLSHGAIGPNPHRHRAVYARGSTFA